MVAAINAVTATTGPRIVDLCWLSGVQPMGRGARGGVCRRTLRMIWSSTTTTGRCVGPATGGKLAAWTRFVLRCGVSNVNKLLLDAL